jgi:hypothetical protein
MFMDAAHIHWRYFIEVNLPLIRHSFFLKIGQERIERVIVNIFLGEYFPFLCVDITLNLSIPDIAMLFEIGFFSIFFQISHSSPLLV